MNKPIFQRRYVWGYLFALALFCFFAVYSFMKMKEAAKQSHAEKHILDAERNMDRVWQNVQDLRSAYRTFVLSGNQASLYRYRDLRHKLGQDTTVLLQTIASDTRENSVREMLGMLNPQLDYMDQAVQMRLAGNLPEALARISSSRNQAIFDGIRDRVDEFDNVSNSLLFQNITARRETHRRTTLIFGILTGLFIITVAGILVLENRAIRSKFSQEVARKVDQEIVNFVDILDRVNDGFVALDNNWKFVYLNQKACDLTGGSREELIGRNLWDVFPDDGKSEFFIAYRRAMETQQYVFIESCYEPWGTWWENHIYPSPRGISIYFKDITARKKAEARLKKLTERFNLMVKATNDVLWDADMLANTLWWNENFYEKYGYPRQEGETIGSSWENRIHPDDRQGVIAHIESAMANRQTDFWENEYRFARAHGGYVHIYDRCLIIRDEEGRVIRMVGSMTDVTALFDARKELQWKEERYRSLVEQASDFIMICDTDGNLLDVNSSMCKAFGYTRDELLRRNVADLVDQVSLAVRPLRFDLIQKGEYILSIRPMVTRTGRVIDVESGVKKLPDGRILAIARDISDRQEAEKELRKSNERFELIAQTTNEALWEYEFASDTAWGNGIHQELYGMPAEGPVPSHAEWKNRIHPDDRQRIVSSYNAALASSGHYWEGEYRFRKGDGTQVTIYGRTFILRDDAGKPSRLMGSMTDITHRKKAEEEINKARELAEKLIDSIPGIFFLCDDKGRFIRWNAQIETVLGYSSGNLASMNVRDCLVAEERGLVDEKMNKVFAEGILDTEASLLTKDGEQLKYYFKLMRIVYEGDPCLLVNGVDITERTKMESELRISENKYRSLVEQAADAIFIFDEEGRFLDVNDVSAQLLGYTRAELTALAIPDILFTEDLVKLPLGFESLRKGDAVIRRRRFRRKDGTEVFVEVHSKKMPDGSYLGMVRDLTERIEAEKQLEESFLRIRELTSHLQHIREEERAHIAREIHDELGQQLTVMKMDIAWLGKKISLEEEQVRSKLRQMTELVDGTVKTVRRISSELRPSLLDDLGLVAAMDWHLKEFENRSGIKACLEEPLQDLQVSEAVKTGLFRIFQESLTNVARHARASHVIVKLQQKGINIEMSIEDDGEGFNKLQVDQKRTLGILGMKERSMMMGGKYEISSIPGRGTRVRVSVPDVNLT